jgi:LytS/YehU family sensor histidine kinase
LIKSDLAPQVVLRLSDILRYVLYETSEGKVDLQKELQHLSDFVSLEQMRVGDRVKVEIELEEPMKDFLVEPMLFLTLIENAFKHGAQSASEEGWVKITGTSLVGGYSLFVENSKPIEYQASAHGGIGLDNLKKRLNYIYPESHELIIINEEYKYSVKLNIELHYAE